MTVQKPFFKYICLYALAVAILLSCNKHENAPALDMDLQYYPLKENSVNIYNVDSTVYNDFNNSITKYQFLIKDTVTNKYIDATGNTAYRIERYKKSGTTDWSFQKVISRKVTSNRAEEFLDNRRYIRLVFPPVLNLKWNGNLYNDLEHWDYTITQLDEKQSVNSLNFNHTLTVEQINEVNFIREDIYIEKYAKEVGLISKEVRAIDKEISSGKIKKGFIYKMQLNTYK
ncbi:hypothetical protein [Pedobacter sp.]|uniref:hypothetical protein n=1 Tax=Pedobacter sp. TaxID=1411316 RepID=UPI00396CE0D0